ncbi:hypothetical protein BFP70_19180 [Thioclava sp. SK-1]|uniref:autotransporter-associated beta strand repeat-containing protein n=1 Tax=Thioclava sp. SK-1 TaxID=1889770 RepID=UPI00082536C6|nr:autotransporter-associated beta strand repeat-containing protein [Thioclava sp. SK-1]OCX58181.1 hypothetical protein BFP70_19180 [Thioclava sp. SK-1]
MGSTALVAVVSSSRLGHADDYFWNGLLPSTWADASAWNLGLDGTPGGGDTAIFGNHILSDIDLNGAQSAAIVRVTGEGLTGSGYQFSNGTLALAGTDADAIPNTADDAGYIIVEAGVGTAQDTTFDIDLELDADLVLDIQSDTVLSGGFADTGPDAATDAFSVTKTGAATLTLTQAAAFDQLLTVNDGTFALGTGGALANLSTLVIETTGTQAAFSTNGALNSGAAVELRDGTFTVAADQTVASLDLLGGTVDLTQAILTVTDPVVATAGATTITGAAGITTGQFAGTVTVDGDTTSLTFADSAIYGSTTLDVTGGATVTFDDSAVANGLLSATVTGVDSDTVSSLTTSAAGGSLSAATVLTLQAFGQATILGTETIDDVTLDADAGLAVDGSLTLDDSFTMAGTITGTGDLVLSDGGSASSLDVSGFTGGVTVAGGTLTLDGSTQLGATALSVASGAAMSTASTGGGTLSSAARITSQGDLTFGAETISELTTTGGAMVVNGDLVIDGSGVLDTTDSQLGAAISGTGGLSIANTTATLETANGYSGGTLVTDATLEITASGALGAGGLAMMGGSANLGAAGAMASGSQLTLDGGATVLFSVADTLDTNIIVENGTIAAANGVVATVTGTLTAQGDSNEALTFGALGQEGTIVLGPMSSVSSVMPVGIAAGTVQVADSLVGTTLFAGDILTMSSGAALDLNGTDTTVAGLVGQGVITTNGATASLILTGSASTFGGDLSDGAGSLALVIDHAAQTTILAQDYSYSGETRLAAGQLNITGTISSDVITVQAGSLSIDAAALQATADVALTGLGGAFTVNGAQVLNSVTAQASDTVTLSDTLTVTTDADTTIAGTLAGAGTLVKQGIGQLSLSADGSGFIGDIAVENGTLSVSNTLAAATLDIDAATVVLAADTVLNARVALNTDSSVLQLSGDNSLTGLVSAASGAQVMTGAAQLTLNVADNSAAAAPDQTFAGVIAGTGPLVKRGAGVVILSGANSFTGAVTVSDGSLDVTGSLASTAINVGAATLIVDGSSLASTADVRLNGIGAALTVNGAETIGSLTASSDSLVTLNDTLTLASDANTELSGDLTGIGGLVKQGLGSVTISGDALYSGVTTVTDGTLRLTGALGSALAQVEAGAELDLAGADLSATVVTLANSGSAVGTLSLSTSSQVAGLSGAGAVDLAGYTLTLGDAGDYSFSGQITGTNTSILRKVGSGTLSVTDQIASYGGTLRVEEGTLLANGASALGNSKVDLAGGQVSVTQDTTFDGTLESGIATSSILAADVNTTLTLDGALIHNGSLQLGSATQAGTIVANFSMAATSAVASTIIAGGTVQLGSAVAANGLLHNAGSVVLADAATLDINGQAVTLTDLTGAGTLTNSQALGTLTLAGTTLFAGDILRDTTQLIIDTNDSVTLTGRADFSNSETQVTDGALVLDSANLRFGSIVVGTDGVVTLDAVDSTSAVSVTNAGTGSSNAGTVAQLRNTAGSFTNTGTIGTLNATGGLISNEGTVTGTLISDTTNISNSGTVAGIVTLTGSGNFTNFGTVNGAASASGSTVITNGSPAADTARFAQDLQISDTVSLTNYAVIDGQVLASGDSSVTGPGVFGSDVTLSQQASLTLSDGAQVQGAVAITGTGTLAVAQGSSVQALTTIGAGITAQISGDIAGLNSSGTVGLTTSASAGDTAILAGTLTHAGQIDGTLVASGTASVVSTGTVSGAVTLSDASTLSVDDGQLLGDVAMSGTSLVQIAGAAQVVGAITVADTAALTVASGAQLGGALAVTGGSATIGTTIGAITNSGTLRLLAGSVADSVVSSAGVGVAAGTIGTLAVSGGTFDAQGTVSGAVTVSGGTVTNSGTMQDTLGLTSATMTQTGTVAGAVTADASALTLGGGALNGTLTLSGTSTVMAQAGRVTGQTTINSGAVVTAAGTDFSDIMLAGGALTILADTTVDGDLTNGGTITSGASDMQVTVAQTFTNAGVIAASGGNSLVIAADTIVLAAGSSIADGANVRLIGSVETATDLTLDKDWEGDLRIVSGGSATVINDISGAGYDIDNRAAVALQDVTQLTDIAAFTNSGTVQLGAGAALSAQSLGTTSGSQMVLGAGASVAAQTIASAGDITVGDAATLSANTTITNSGTLSFTGAGTISATALSNNGTVDIDGAQTVSLFGDTDLNNTAGGTLTIGTGSTLSGATTSVRNSGTATAKAQIAVHNGATLAVATLENAANGVIDNAGTITLGTTLVNAENATLTTSGTVNADIDSAGDMTNSGTIAGDVALTGAATLTNAAGTVQGDVVLADDSTLTNTVGAQIVGDVTVTDGAILNAGSIAGSTDLSGSATLSNSGALTGAVTLSNGTRVTNIATGAIYGTTTVGAGAVLEAAGGSFETVTVATGGQIDVSASTHLSGDLINAGTLENTSDTALTIDISDGRFTNTGTVIGGTGNLLTITADTIVVDESGTITGTTLYGDIVSGGTISLIADLTGAIITEAGSVTEVANTLSAASNNITNGSLFTVLEGVALNDVGVYSNAGQTTIETGGTLAAQTINNAAGAQISVGGDASLIGTGNTLNNSGVILVADGGTVTDAGNIENLSTGVISFLGGGTLEADNNDTGNVLNNAGVIQSAGTGSTVVLGNGVSDGINNLAGGQIAIGAGDTFDGAAVQLTSAGDITIGAGATLALAGLQTDTGATVTNAGTISGDITVAGGSFVTLASGTTGDVTVGADGSLNHAGTAATITSAGDLTLRAGGTAQAVISSGDGATNAGTVGQLTVSAGDFTNSNMITDGATLTGGQLTNTGTVSGAVSAFGAATMTNSGTISDTVELGAGATLTSSGTLAGVVTVADGAALTVTNGTAAQIVTAGTTTVQGGAIAAAQSSGVMMMTGGAVTDSLSSSGTLTTVDSSLNILTVTDGTADLSRTTVNNLTNRAAVIADVDTQIGTVMQTAGTLALNGTVSGSTVISGGDVTVSTTGQLAGLTQVTGGTMISAGSVADLSVSDGGRATLNAGSAQSVTIGTTGAVTIGASASAQAVTNAGSLNSAGTVASLTNTNGVATLTGTVTGDVLANGGTVLSGGAIAGDLQVDGATVTVQSAATVAGTTDVTAGTLTVAGTVADLTNAASVVLEAGSTAQNLSNAGDLTLAGRAQTVDNTGSLNVVSGTITGALTNSATGTATVSGTIGADVTNRDSATLTFVGDTALAGLVQGSDVTATVQSGTVTVADGGTVENATTLAITGGTLTGSNTVLSNAGTMTIGTAGMLSMDLQNAADAQSVIAGALTGDVSNAGTMTVSGSLTGDVTTTGLFTLATGRALAGDLMAAATAQTQVAGTVSGDVQNLGTLGLAGAVDGDLTNSGRVTIDGIASVSGTITNLGDMFVNDTLAFGLLTNDATVDSATGDGSDTVTDARLQVGASGILAGNVINNTVLGVSDGGSVTGALRNASILVVDGAVQAGGALTNAAGAVIDMADGAGDDSITVSGDAVLNGTLYYDVDLSGTASAADTITIAGAVSGSPTIVLNNLGDDEYGQLSQGYNLIDYGTTSSLTPTIEGLPSGGAILYQLTNNDETSAWQLNSGANPAVGGLASGLALTQSLIGSVVNRPSSPFVSGLAAAEDDPCGIGGWARGTGGQATASGTTQTALGEFESAIDASYAGLQAGFDHSCFGGHYNGWDLSLGGIAGLNMGRTDQAVYRFDSSTGTVNMADVTSFNKTDFTQAYGGLYLGAAKDRFFADIQMRFEQTTFDLQNVVTPGGERLGVSDQTYKSKGATVSGSMGYAFALSSAQGISLVPSLGFSISKTSTDDLKFENDPNDPDDDGLMVIDDVHSQIGFASLTIAKSKVLPSGTSAVNYFGTATVYHDFADPAVSRYYETLDANGRPASQALLSESSNLGTYGELSFGINYTKLLDSGTALPARQLDASVRVDGRFSDTLDGWGITAQMRLQF